MEIITSKKLQKECKDLSMEIVNWVCENIPDIESDPEKWNEINRLVSTYGTKSQEYGMQVAADRYRQKKEENHN